MNIRHIIVIGILISAITISGCKEDMDEKSFELTDTQKDAIITLYEYYGRWDQSMTTYDDWPEYFVTNFVKEYRSGEYLKNIYERDAKATKKEAEHIYYSLTGREISLEMDDDETIEVSDYSAFTREDTIDEYTYENLDDTILVHASIYHEHVQGEIIASDEFYVDVYLKPNPDSCFDGYSILEIKDVTLEMEYKGD